MDQYNDTGIRYNDILTRTGLTVGFHEFISLKNEEKVEIFLYTHSQPFSNQDKDQLRRVWRVWNDKYSWCETSCTIL